MPVIFSGNTDTIEYKGYSLKSGQNGYHAIYQKNFPSHYIPEDSEVNSKGEKIKDINILDGFEPEDYTLINFLLRNPRHLNLSTTGQSGLSIIKSHPSVIGN